MFEIKETKFAIQYDWVIFQVNKLITNLYDIFVIHAQIFGVSLLMVQRQVVYAYNGQHQLKLNVNMKTLQSWLTANNGLAIARDMLNIGNTLGSVLKSHKTY